MITWTVTTRTPRTKVCQRRIKLESSERNERARSGYDTMITVATRTKGPTSKTTVFRSFALNKLNSFACHFVYMWSKGLEHTVRSHE